MEDSQAAAALAREYETFYGADQAPVGTIAAYGDLVAAEVMAAAS